jgi:hypothetical protein
MPARVWLDTSEPERPAMWLAEVNGKPVDAWAWWPRLAGNRITEAEFSHLTRVVAWAESSAPHAPEASPRQAINLSRQPAFAPRRTV